MSDSVYCPVCLRRYTTAPTPRCYRGHEGPYKYVDPDADPLEQLRKRGTP